MYYYMKKRFKTLDEAFENVKKCSFALEQSDLTLVEGETFDKIQESIDWYYSGEFEGCAHASIELERSFYPEQVMKDFNLQKVQSESPIRCFVYETVSGDNSVEIAELYDSENNPYYEVVYRAKSYTPRDYSTVVESFTEDGWECAEKTYEYGEKALTKEEEAQKLAEYERHLIEEIRDYKLVPGVHFDIEYNNIDGVIYINSHYIATDTKKVLTLMKNNPEIVTELATVIDSEIKRIETMEIPTSYDFNESYIKNSDFYIKRKNEVLKTLKALKAMILQKFPEKFAKREDEYENIDYQMMIGVLPGYGHENQELTPKTAIQIGRQELQKSFSEDQKVNSSCKLASAVYSLDFKCPEGGELGIMVNGSFKTKEQEEQLIKSVKNMMKNLGQHTVTIELSKNGNSCGSIYISDCGEKVFYNDPKNQEVEHFSVKIPADKISFTELGSRFQDALSQVSKADMYMISGILTGGVDKDGNYYYEYTATQNPEYGQTDADKYRKSVIQTVRSATGDLTSSVVEFNKYGVIVQKEEPEEEERA